MISYLDEQRNVVQRKTVAQDCLNKDTKRQDMQPDHNTLAPTGAPHTQRLTADLALLVGDAVQLLLLFLAAALDVLVLARRPFLVAGLLQKLVAKLLECRHGEQHKLLIVSDLDRRSWHYHRCQCFVARQELLFSILWYGNEVRLEVF